MSTMALLRAMVLGIKTGFRYERRNEKGVQHPTETLKQHSGSCRDFAVLMMEAVRSMGLAAASSAAIFSCPTTSRPRAAGPPTPGCRSICPAPAGSISIRPTASSAIAI